MKRKVITCLAGLSLLASANSALAWSYKSYDQIVAAAQRYDLELTERMDYSKDINFTKVKHYPYQNQALGNLYVKYGRVIPDEIKKIIRTTGYDQTKFTLRSRGFGRVLVNNIPTSHKTFLTYTLEETNPEIKLALLSFLTLITAQAYQPITKVVFFNSRDFSRGDQSGQLFCIQNKRTIVPKCKNNLFKYWTTLMDNQVFNIDGVHPTSNIEKVIENSANQAVFAYETKLYRSLSYNYQANANNVLSKQANAAASHIVSLWRQVYTQN